MCYFPRGLILSLQLTKNLNRMTLFKELSLRFKFFLGSLFYLTYAPHAFVYSLKRDRLNRQFPPPPTAEGFENPGKLLRAESSPRGANFYFEKAELEVTFLTTDLVRIDWKPGVPPVPYAIARQHWAEVATKLEETGNNWTVSTEAVNVVIEQDGSLKLCNKTGEILREEMPPQREGEGWIHKAELRKEENIYGLGERAAPLNLRDTRDGRVQASYRMWNFDAAGMYGPGADPL